MLFIVHEFHSVAVVKRAFQYSMTVYSFINMEFSQSLYSSKGNCEFERKRIFKI